MRPLFHPTPPKWCQRCEDFSGANRSNRWLVPDVQSSLRTWSWVRGKKCKWMPIHQLYLSLAYLISRESGNWYVTWSLFHRPKQRRNAHPTSWYYSFAHHRLAASIYRHIPNLSLQHPHQFNGTLTDLHHGSEQVCVKWGQAIVNSLPQWYYQRVNELVNGLPACFRFSNFSH